MLEEISTGRKRVSLCSRRKEVQEEVVLEVFFDSFCTSGGVPTSVVLSENCF